MQTSKKSIFIILFYITALFAHMILFPDNIKADEHGAAPDYMVQMASWEKSGGKDTTGRNIEIKSSSYSRKSSLGDISTGAFGGKSDVLVWNSAEGEVEYTFNVPEAGFYNVYFEHYVTSQTSEQVERGLMIGGSLPFSESSNFILGQKFEHTTYPFEKDREGNDVRSKQVEIKEWMISPVYDRMGYYGEPLKYYFTKGENRITLTGGRGTVAISRIILKSPEKLLSYDEYKKNTASAKVPENFLQELEAENISAKSAKSIQILSISEPGVSPEAYGTRIFNTIGGTKWRNAHEWIEWELEAPEDGIYNIGLKFQQNFSTNLNTYRRVEIDGIVPFKELLTVSFSYEQGWQNLVLGDNKPYGFYLTKGKHTLRLTVTSSPYKEIAKELQNIVVDLRDLDFEIKAITGISSNEKVDVYRIWNLKEYIPDLDNKLLGYSESIRKQIDILKNITHADKNAFNELTVAAMDLEKLAKNLEEIPKRPDSISLIHSNIMNWSLNLNSQPLTIDKLMIKSPDKEFLPAKPGVWKNITYFVKNFFLSFTANKGNSLTDDEDTIQVWVQRNRDYVNLMQEFADQYFTPQTGFKVNVNYIPGPNMLVLANAAGKQPDIATGVGVNTPFEFAVRNALINLNQFPEYEQIKKAVEPGALVPYHYNKGDYGFPEEVTYNVMFYREDILKQLGIKPPETWEDVKKIIPTLQQNNCNFYYPFGDFQTFFFQNGVEVYTEDGMDLGFDNQKGFQSFKYWTDLYVKYGLPQRMTSFYQHFRLGDVPIGITNINQYVMFRLTAPEISNLWKIAPIPGTLDSRGNNLRWQGGEERGLMMFKTNEERQKRAWEFMKWWLSTDTQANFANDLENYYGIEFRWYPANVEALKRVPWDQDEKATILKQLSWFKAVPYIPGGSYITTREIRNAWTRTVIDKGNYREELEKSIEEIRREIERKQMEFGLVDKDGTVIKKLDIPQVPIPGKENEK